jgi:Flp pilus assembly pilin Flp
MGIEDRLDPGRQRVTTRRFRIFSRFCSNRSGSTAIEFGMLALPFALLLFAILETCISFAAQQVIANATDDIARQIRTGQIKGDDLTEQRLHDFICGRMEMMVASGCPDLAIDLRTRPTFSALAQIPMPITGIGQNRVIDESLTGFEKAQSMERSMLRVLYPWPIMTNLMQKSLSTLADGKILLFATATWQNEPF